MLDGFAFLLIVASRVRAQLCSTFLQLQLTHSQQGDKQKRDCCSFVQLQLTNTTVLRAEGQQL